MSRYFQKHLTFMVDCILFFIFALYIGFMINWCWRIMKWPGVNVSVCSLSWLRCYCHSRQSSLLSLMSKILKNTSDINPWSGSFGPFSIFLPLILIVSQLISFVWIFINLVIFALVFTWKTAEVSRRHSIKITPVLLPSMLSAKCNLFFFPSDIVSTQPSPLWGHIY